MRCFALSLMCWSGMTLAAAPATVVEPGMVLIPAGEFVMGSDKKEDAQTRKEFGNIKPWYLDEHPEHKVILPAFEIDQFETTNTQYREFVTKNQHAPPTAWVDSGYILSLKMDKVTALDVEQLRKVATKVFHLDIDTRKLDKEQLLKAVRERLAAMDKLPVTFVNWFEAEAYCKWAGKRLPSETEWEKAARGTQGSEFPWGKEWAAGKANTGDESWDDGVAPVGSYKTDKSPFEVYDLAGNVSEWVADSYTAYPGSDYKSDDFGPANKVYRGAAWGREGHYAIHLFQRGAYRGRLSPDSALADVGFRCARDIQQAANTKGR